MQRPQLHYSSSQWALMSADTPGVLDLQAFDMGSTPVQAHATAATGPDAAGSSVVSAQLPAASHGMHQAQSIITTPALQIQQLGQTSTLPQHWMQQGLASDQSAGAPRLPPNASPEGMQRLHDLQQQLNSRPFGATITPRPARQLASPSAQAPAAGELMAD